MEWMLRLMTAITVTYFVAASKHKEDSTKKVFKDKGERNRENKEILIPEGELLIPKGDEPTSAETNKDDDITIKFPEFHIRFPSVTIAKEDHDDNQEKLEAAYDYKVKIPDIKIHNFFGKSEPPKESKGFDWTFGFPGFNFKWPKWDWFGLDSYKESKDADDDNNDNNLFGFHYPRVQYKLVNYRMPSYRYPVLTFRKEEPKPLPPQECTHDVDSGQGKDKQTRYFFSVGVSKCIPFVFKGQGGNENNFDTKESCETKCTP